MSEVDNTGNNARQVTAWNVAGAVVGALLAALTIFGVVSSQSNAQQPAPADAQVLQYNS